MGKIDDIDKQEKTRTSVYITEENRRRLAKIPRGEKTRLINEALDDALTELDRKVAYGKFVESLKTLKRVKSKKTSEELVRELRETGTIEREL